MGRAEAEPDMGRFEARPDLLGPLGRGQEVERLAGRLGLIGFFGLCVCSLKRFGITGNFFSECPTYQRSPLSSLKKTGDHLWKDPLHLKTLILKSILIAFR